MFYYDDILLIMATIEPKRKTKTSYRGDKKPSMAARKKAAQKAVQREKKKTGQPSGTMFQRGLSLAADISGILLLFAGALILFSLRFPEMNTVTQRCVLYVRFYAGKSGIFLGLVVLFLGIWLIALRRIRKPFSFSWRYFLFFTVVYLFALVVIQHDSNLRTPFVSPEQAGGVFADSIDRMLITALGTAGAAILYVFIGLILLLIFGRELLRILPENVLTAVQSILRLPLKLQELPVFSRRQEPETVPEDIDIAQPSLFSNFPDMPSFDPDDGQKANVKKEKSSAADPSANEVISSSPSVENTNGRKKAGSKTGADAPISLPAASFKPTVVSGAHARNAADPANEISDPWRLPVVDEILDPLKVRHAITPEDAFVQGQVQKIEQVLDAFDAPGKVVDIQCGPTFTQYGIEPGFLERADRRTRVRVKQIESLKKDLEMALSVKQLTVEAPIPNKTFIGLQVQNKARIPVGLREVIESNVFKKTRKGLGIALGKDINGMVYAADLTRMPHLLIAGATGSGKSVCLNAILVCLLLHYTPEQLKLVLIDPKRVELSGYNGIPHLITPVVTDVEQVGNVLQWLLQEMDMRNLHFLQSSVRNIQDYNQKNPEKALPYIVVVIDELANLMMEAASDIESSITRLAQTARAMGIHLIVATQRPSRDVITGTIKGNLPSRIAFAVATNIDSHVILDRSGAENLFGKGDMYFLSVDDSNLKRLQCVYVSDDEIKKLVDYWRKNPRVGDEPSTESAPVQPVTTRQPPAVKQGLLTQLPLLDETASADKKDQDPLLDSAIAMVRKQGRASANMLVSRLSIGFTRANKLLAEMENRGIISPPNANPAIPREILDYGGVGVSEDE